MFRILLALAFCVLVLPAYGAEKKDTPTHPVVVQSPVSVQIQDDRGTDKKPLVITGNVSVQKTDEDKAVETNKEQEDHDLTSATKQLAVGTFILGFFSLIAAILTYWNIRLTKEAAEVLPKLERAYLFVTVGLVRFMRVPEDEKFQDLRIQINIHNHGKTPAILKVMRYDSTYGEHAPIGMLEIEDRALPEGLVIGARTDHPETFSKRLNDEERAAIKDVIQHVFVFGSVEYEDVVGDKHKVGFCWSSQSQALNPNKVAFVICQSPLNYFT